MSPGRGWLFVGRTIRVLLGLCGLGIVLVEDVRGDVGGVVRENHGLLEEEGRARVDYIGWIGAGNWLQDPMVSRNEPKTVAGVAEEGNGRPRRNPPGAPTSHGQLQECGCDATAAGSSRVHHPLLVPLTRLKHKMPRLAAGQWHPRLRAILLSVLSPPQMFTLSAPSM